MNVLKKINIDDEILYWLSALTITFQYVCATISVSMISVILAIFIAFVSIFELLKKRVFFSINFVVITCTIICVFFISSLVVSDTSYTYDYLSRFILFDVLALFVGMQLVDRNQIIKKVVVIGFIGLPFVLFTNLTNVSMSARMGIAYSCLPILIVSLMGFGYGKIYAVMSIINVVTILIKYTTFAPRGVWVIILSFVMLCLYKFICGRQMSGAKYAVSIFALVMMFIGAIYVINNFETLVITIDELLKSKLNIDVYALEKIIRYTAQDKLYNGRDSLWTLSMEIAGGRPFFGYGIGYFETLSNGQYCHNIFLQSLCEAGVFFFIPILTYLFFLVISLLKGATDNDSFKWNVLIFCCGIEILFFSSVYWMWIPFWYFMGSFLKYQECRNSSAQFIGMRLSK